VVFYATYVLFHVPIPGRWGDLVYFAVVLVPTFLAAFLIWLVTMVLYRPPWRRS
jgi:hypothetical protein